ncbi:MAG TPA: hypothetical protein PKI55_15235, partial [Chitinophagaceae bacterium]|nr:hypothetical protein [Chitinophagaceae bacterium]
KQHGSKISEASEMWMAAIGPSVKATGESKEKMQAFQGQIAATIALILGKEFKPTHPVMQALVLGSK